MILRRIANDRFSEVRPNWMGAMVVLLGGGPSLTADQVELVRESHADGDVRVIAINDAYLLAPWAGVQYAADAKWHRWQCAGVAKPQLGLGAAQVRAAWSSFAGQKCTIENSSARVADESVHILRNAHGDVHGFGISLDPRALVTGRNSGFQALNLAVLAGAATVVLLGFDGKPGADGRTHWFGEHPEPSNVSVFKMYQQAMSAAEDDIAAAGVRVVNCSPGSAIDAFPKRLIEEML